MTRSVSEGTAPPSPEVDAVLAGMPDDVRRALEALRGTIRATAPGAQESINYGVPAFKYRGRPFVSFGATKNHCAFYVQSPAVMEAHRDKLTGYDTSKGTVRFSATEPLPEEMVVALVKARMAEIDAAATR
jgi:uncharacterized protein YdhG (YjbR/CyaY superfamily)